LETHLSLLLLLLKENPFFFQKKNRKLKKFSFSRKMTTHCDAIQDEIKNIDAQMTRGKYNILILFRTPRNKLSNITSNVALHIRRTFMRLSEWKEGLTQKQVQILINAANEDALALFQDMNELISLKVIFSINPETELRHMCKHLVVLISELEEILKQIHDDFVSFSNSNKNQSDLAEVQKALATLLDKLQSHIKN
jgi:hypothetical protein